MPSFEASEMHIFPAINARRVLVVACLAASACLVGTLAALQHGYTDHAIDIRHCVS